MSGIKKHLREMKVGEKCYLHMDSYKIHPVPRDVKDVIVLRSHGVSEEEIGVYNVPIKREDNLTYSVEVKGIVYLMNFMSDMGKITKEPKDAR